MNRAWLAGALVAVTAHASFAAWVGLREPAAPPRELPRIEMELAALPPPPAAPVVEPPEPQPPPPALPKPAPRPVVHHVAAAPPAPPPAAPKIGIDESATADKGLAVATGVTTDGELGTGTSTDTTPAPPTPPAAPPPPPPPPAAAPKGPHVFKAFEVTRMPRAKHAVSPEIPDAFKQQAQREALVVVEVVIDARGAVVDARVLRHAEFGLDDAALTAARATEFEPALVGTDAVAVRYQIPYRFKVRG